MGELRFAVLLSHLPISNPPNPRIAPNRPARHLNSIVLPSMSSSPTHRASTTGDHHQHHLSNIEMAKDSDFATGTDGLNLSKTQTTGGMTISPELFEKLYLTPKVPHVGDYYKRFANPTPMGFVGFVISTFTFAMVNMGWGGAEGLAGVAGIFFVRCCSFPSRGGCLLRVRAGSLMGDSSSDPSSSSSPRSSSGSWATSSP